MCGWKQHVSYLCDFAFAHTVERERIEGQIEGQVKTRSPLADYLSTLGLIVLQYYNRKKTFSIFIVNLTLSLYASCHTQAYQKLMTSFIS